MKADIGIVKQISSNVIPESIYPPSLHPNVAQEEVSLPCWEIYYGQIKWKL